MSGGFFVLPCTGIKKAASRLLLSAWTATGAYLLAGSVEAASLAAAAFLAFLCFFTFFAGAAGSAEADAAGADAAGAAACGAAKAETANREATRPAISLDISGSFKEDVDPQR
jgi:hypothetical protein